MNDRRRHPRQPVHLLAQHSELPGGGLEVDYVKDLSPGGLFLATAKGLKQEATFHVQFSPAKDTRLVSAFCRVARVTPQGVGVQFLSLDDEARALIDQVVA